MKTLLLLLSAFAIYGQPEFRMSQKNTDTGYQLVLGYSGSNVVYVCRTPSIQPVSASISIASATNANPVVFTVSAGHGFDLSSKPKVTISGGTGNWTGVNGELTATPINTTTFSVAVNSTAYGAVTGTLVYTSRAPLITSRIWSVMSLAYDGSNNLIWTGWSSGVSAQTQTCTAAPSQVQ